MPQPSPVPVAAIAERFRTGAGRRGLAISLAVLVEGLLLLLLLSFSAEERPRIREEEEITVANLEANQVSEESPEPNSPDPAQPAEGQSPPRPPAEESLSTPPAEPRPAQPSPPIPTPTAPATVPTPSPLPSSSTLPRRAAPPAGQVYGPPNTGGSSSSRDTERVGTAPNGEPLYAAAWHREPRPGDLRDYLSTARGPGWGLIACRTAPNYRVEDCVALDEYPEGSQINRAILAAAWEFQVRPPRRGGQLLVGSWVRIRIDYRTERR